MEGTVESSVFSAGTTKNMVDCSDPVVSKISPIEKSCADLSHERYFEEIAWRILMPSLYLIEEDARRFKLSKTNKPFAERYSVLLISIAPNLFS